MQSEQLTYFSKCPPSKRPNYFLNGIVSPFQPLWSNIVRDWAIECKASKTESTEHRFDVLRDRHIRSLDALRQHLYSLIPVRISVKGNKGVIDNTTLIYMPTSMDLQNEKKPIVESRHPDRARQEERKLRKAKQTYQRGKTMVRLIEERVNNSQSSIINDCDRKLLGAMTSGSFQFSRACCTGKGFIAVGGLISLLEEQKNSKQSFRKVLIRTTTSQYYHWGMLEY